MNKSEPVALGYLVTGAVNAVLAAGAAFDVANLDPAQTGAVFGLANIVTLWICAVKTRRVVYSPATVERAELEAEHNPHALES